MTGPTLIPPAATEPVSLEALKDHLVLDGEAGDLDLLRRLKAARRRLEGEIGRGLAQETWEQVFDAAEVVGERLPLWRGPVNTIVSVTARYADGTSEVVPATDYYEVSDGLALAAGASWPAGLRTYEALAVRYTGGMTSLEGTELDEAVLKLASAMYTHRGDEDFASSGTVLPPDIEALVAPWRPVRVR